MGGFAQVLMEGGKYLLAIDDGTVVGTLPATSVFENAGDSVWDVAGYVPTGTVGMGIIANNHFYQNYYFYREFLPH